MTPLKALRFIPKTPVPTTIVIAMFTRAGHRDRRNCVDAGMGFGGPPHGWKRMHPCEKNCVAMETDSLVDVDIDGLVQEICKHKRGENKVENQ